MSTGAAQQTDPEEQLCALAASLTRDPVRFVMAAYPWGEVGGPLAKYPGPDDWQVEVLAYIRDNLGLGRPLRIAVAGGIGPNDLELKADLPAVEYGYKMLNGKDVIILEKKEDMKKRGLSSPDDGDALALTFAYVVAQSDQTWQFTPAAQHDDGRGYNPIYPEAR